MVCVYIYACNTSTKHRLFESTDLQAHQNQSHHHLLYCSGLKHEIVVYNNSHNGECVQLNTNLVSQLVKQDCRQQPLSIKHMRQDVTLHKICSSKLWKVKLSSQTHSDSSSPCLVVCGR